MTTFKVIWLYVISYIMDGHTSETLATLKNEMIGKMQDMFYEYNRMHQVVLQTKTEDDIEKRQMIDTIRKMGDTEQVRLTTIQCLEEDILKLQKTTHEYAEMIKAFEDKLAEKDKDTESSNKFSMIRIQADELGKKDMEIERLNKLIYNLKKKAKESMKLEEVKEKGPMKLEEVKEVKAETNVIGWSPTSSKTPKPKPDIIDLVLQKGEEVQEEDVEEVEVTSEKSESESVEEVETEETEETGEVVVEKAEIFMYRKKEYYTIQGDKDQVVYEVLEGDNKGKRLGTWSLNAKGKKKVTFEKK